MSTIRVPAIRYYQCGHVLYTFVMDGKHLDEIADSDPLRLDGDGNTTGYQREEIRDHIKEIRNYIETNNAMIPNSLVLGFHKPPKFVSIGKDSRLGDLYIELRSARKVDGLQRAAACRDAAVDRFDVSITGFVAEDEGEMKEHFIRVNRQKPLPRGLIHEMLPSITGSINPELDAKKVPAKIMLRMNSDKDSPLRDRIRTTAGKKGLVAAGTFIESVEDMMGQGFLDDDDTEQAIRVLKNYWRAVQECFPEAWSLNSRQSRLFHAAGVAGMSSLMNAITENQTAESLTLPYFRSCLRKIAPHCSFTSGSWNLGQGDVRPWDGIENTKRGGKILSHYLVRTYRSIKRGNSKAAGRPDNTGLRVG